MSAQRNEREAPGGDDTNAETMMALVARAQTGDRLALDELLVRCLPPLQRWAHGRLPAYARGALDTDDLVQQAAYQTLRRLHLFQPRHVFALQAYLREAVVNRIRDAVRRQSRAPAMEDLPEEHSDERAVSPLEELIRQETVERYQEGLARLKPGDRRAAVLRMELDLNFDEMAERLGKPSAAAARMATKRALERLATILGHHRRRRSVSRASRPPEGFPRSSSGTG